MSYSILIDQKSLDLGTTKPTDKPYHWILCPDNKVHGANMGPIWGRYEHMIDIVLYKPNQAPCEVNIQSFQPTYKGPWKQSTAH